ncbi:hypothetical protein SCALM49S_08284 [Streptomyces californicus]
MQKRIVASEFLGTLLLVFFAVGSAVVAVEYLGTVGIALTFGFTLLAQGGASADAPSEGDTAEAPAAAAEAPAETPSEA